MAETPSCVWRKELETTRRNDPGQDEKRSIGDLQEEHGPSGLGRVDKAGRMLLYVATDRVVCCSAYMGVLVDCCETFEPKFYRVQTRGKSWHKAVCEQGLRPERWQPTSMTCTCTTLRHSPGRSSPPRSLGSRPRPEPGSAWRLWGETSTCTGAAQDTIPTPTVLVRSEAN